MVQESRKEVSNIVVKLDIPSSEGFKLIYNQIEGPIIYTKETMFEVEQILKEFGNEASFVEAHMQHHGGHGGFCNEFNG